MAAAHVQSGSSGANTDAPSHTLAGTPAEGNLLVAGVSLGNTTTHTAVNGYTKIDGPTTRIAYYWKVAGASEPAAQAPCTLAAARDCRCGVAEYSGNATSSPLDVSGSAADATSPQDLAAINPTDSIDTLMVGFASASSVAPTWSGQTIGGSAATERVDADEGGNAALTMFDRLNVNTGADTFAAQATASVTPTNGAIALLIFRLVTVSVQSFSGAVTPTGALVKRVNKPLAGAIASAGALAVLRVIPLAVAGAIALAGSLVKRVDKPLAGTIALAGGLVRSVSKALGGAIALAGALVTFVFPRPGSAVASDALRFSLSSSDAARGSAVASDALRHSATVAEDGGD